MVSGAAIDVILVYQVPAMAAAGLSTGAAATIGGLRGLAQLGGRVPLSPVLAALGSRRTIVCACIAGALSSALLLASGHLPAAIAYSVVAGASIGAIYTLQGIYTNELVGSDDLSLLMAAQQALFAVGGAVGPLIAGTILQAGGGYTPVVLLSAAGMCAAALILAGGRSHPAGAGDSLTHRSGSAG